MSELDAKIKETKAEIEVKNGELDILEKEKELEKQKETLLIRDRMVAAKRREVERLREANKTSEEEEKQVEGKFIHAILVCRSL